MSAMTVDPAARSAPRPKLAWGRLRAYFSLIKSLQTGLLLVTAAAGYTSGCCLNLTAASLASMLGSLFLAVSGSTVLNMAWDRDIDACMGRTARRPLATGQITAREAWLLGGLLTAAGLLWAAALNRGFAAVVLAGVFFDVVVYTMLLKRRTPFSILIGGLAGGMPVLAGRVLAVGAIDGVGLLLALGVLLWIPTHMLTFSIKYQADYARAGVPTFPALIGVPAARRLIAVSTFLAVSTFFAAGQWIGLSLPLLSVLGFLGALLTGMVSASLFWPRPRLNFALYKGASIYMLASMLLLIAGGL